MRVVELFVSLQGEGVLAGTKSFFIRTAGCNLRCRWCDTPEAVVAPRSSHRSTNGLVEEALRAGCRHVVVTGGEPLLQREIGSVTAALRAHGLHVTVETAGTVAPEFECDLLSLSPKTANSDPSGAWSGTHRRRRTNLAPARALLRRFPNAQVKFVVRDREDVKDISRLLGRLPHVPSERVLLMPEGKTGDQVRVNAPMVAALCVEYGFRYTPRLQLDFREIEPPGGRDPGGESPV